MRLLVISPRGERLGGAEHLLMTLLQEAGATELSPAVAFLEPGPFEAEVSQLGIPTYSTDAGRLRHARRYLRAVRWLAGLMAEADVALSWTQKAHLYGAPAALLAGMTDRLVWWQHDIPCREWLNVVATALPARAIGTCSHAAADAQSRLVPRRATFTVAAGIAPPEQPSPAAVAALRERLAIPPERFVVGIVARLQLWKGQHHVLRATALLRSHGHDVHCVVVGGDAGGLAPGYGPALRRLAVQLGLGEAVTFTGHVNDAAPYVALADVVVNASQAEPFGLSLLEAMALGVPVVAVDAGGPADILRGERGGLLVPAAEPAELAGALERLVVDADLRARLARSGRSAVQLDYTAARMAADLAEQLALLRGDRRATATAAAR